MVEEKELNEVTNNIIKQINLLFNHAYLGYEEMIKEKIEYNINKGNSLLLKNNTISNKLRLKFELCWALYDYIFIIVNLIKDLSSIEKELNDEYYNQNSYKEECQKIEIEIEKLTVLIGERLPLNDFINNCYGRIRLFEFNNYINSKDYLYKKVK